MDSPPILSIVVPTKNRAQYAKHAIASLLDVPDDDFELVVHDNSDDYTLAEWVDASCHDKRLHYVHTTKPLSMSRNFEHAIGIARGRFIGAIGDDDGMHPGAVALCRWLEREGLDAAAPRHPARYLWPGVSQSANWRDSGRLIIGPFSGRSTFRDPQQGLYACAERGGTRLERLPTLYHGLVRRSCLNAVRRQTGRWLPGVSPDMAAAIALASHVNRIAEVDFPVFLPGASPKSGAGRGVRRTHHGRLAQETYLDRDLVDAWPARVPAYFSGPTMWSAAAIQALQATERHEVLDRFNYGALHGVCLAFVPGHRTATLKSLLRRPGDGGAVLVDAARCARAYAGAWSRRTASLMRRSREATVAGSDVASIRQAVAALVSRCDVSPLSNPITAHSRPHGAEAA